MSVATPGTENVNNVWSASSRGGQYVKLPYLIVGKDFQVKQKKYLRLNIYSFYSKY